MSAIAIAQPKMSAICPDRRSPVAHCAHAGCAASRSPLVQNASPRNPAAPARTPWSSVSARSSVRRACRTVPGTSPRTRARAERYSSIAPGRRRYSSSSATTISPGGARDPAPVAAASSSHRSASRSRTSTSSGSPPVSSAPATAKLSIGLTRTTSSGSALSQPCTVASCLVMRMAGIVRSIRSAAWSKSSPASAWPMAMDGSPFCSYHALARRCRSGTWPGCSSSRRACSTSAKRWW